MSNADNQFDQGFTFEEWLNKWGLHVQGKVDKRGGKVAPEGNNQRVGAEWGNLVDDLMLLVARDGLGGGTTPTPDFEYIDTRASPLTIPEIVGGGTFSVGVTFSTTHNQLDMSWFSLVRQDFVSNQDLMLVEFFSDAAMDNRTHLIGRYEFNQNQLLVNSGTPGSGSTQFRDQSIWYSPGMMLSPFGGELEDPGQASTRRFWLRVTNLNPSQTTKARSFSFIGKAFTLPNTVLPDPGVPPT